MTVGTIDASSTWVPASNPGVSVSVAFHHPPSCTEPLLTENPTGWSSMVKRTFAVKRDPSRFINPVPLSETTRPETLKLEPATGLSVIWSTTRKVNERTVTLERFAWDKSKSELPL